MGTGICDCKAKERYCNSAIYLLFHRSLTQLNADAAYKLQNDLNWALKMQIKITILYMKEPIRYFTGQGIPNAGTQSRR